MIVIEITLGDGTKYYTNSIAFGLRTITFTTIEEERINISIDDVVKANILDKDEESAPRNLRYPCKYCHSDKLITIVGYPEACECLGCGHPNERPTERTLLAYELELSNLNYQAKLEEPNNSTKID